MKIKKYFIYLPEDGKFHIHNQRETVCGKFSIWDRIIIQKDLVKGNEVYKEGQDCPECFKNENMLKNEGYYDDIQVFKEK